MLYRSIRLTRAGREDILTARLRHAFAAVSSSFPKIYNLLTMREKWPDILRSLLMILVVLHHDLVMSGDVRQLYTPYFMSGFFFVSGCFFKGENTALLTFLWKKVRSILVPYLLIGGACYAICEGYKEYICSVGHEAHWEPFFRNFIWDGGYFWFVPCLFAAQVVQYAFVRVCGARDALLLSVSALFSLIVLCLLVYVKPIALPWCFQVACVMQWSMNLGYVLKKRNLIGSIAKIRYVLVSALAYLAVWGVAVYVLHVPKISDLHGYRNVIVYLLLVHAGMVGCLSLSQLVKPFSWLLLIGRSTLCIYFVHFSVFCFMMGTVAVWYNHLCHDLGLTFLLGYQGAVIRLSSVLLGILAGCGLSELLRRYAPWVLGMKPARK